MALLHLQSVLLQGWNKLPASWRLVCVAVFKLKNQMSYTLDGYFYNNFKTVTFLSWLRMDELPVIFCSGQILTSVLFYSQSHTIEPAESVETDSAHQWQCTPNHRVCMLHCGFFCDSSSSRDKKIDLKKTHVRSWSWPPITLSKSTSDPVFPLISQMGVPYLAQELPLNQNAHQWKKGGGEGWGRTETKNSAAERFL